MHINTAMERLESLTEHELKNLLKQVEDQISRYLYTCRNYAPDKMQKYGTPHLNILEEKRQKILSHLK